MIKRNRPRPNGTMRPHRPNQNGYSNTNPRNDENAEVRLKNRGYYQQMYDKYSTAAREALSLGERIEAEGHYQHAEHYLRQLNDRIRYDNEAQQQQQQRYQAQQAQQAQQLAQQQAQQNQQVQQAPAAKITQPHESDVVTESNNVVETDDAESAAPAQEKRPYRKRTLRTPHRRHNPQQDGTQSAAPAAAPSDPA